jgi:hypothetical protein
MAFSTPENDRGTGDLEPDDRGMWPGPALAFLGTVPFYVLAILSPKLGLTLGLLLVPTALALVWLGPVLSAIQSLIPPNMRATASALFLFIINLLGIGLGIYAMGALSDGLRLQFGDDSLRYAILAGSSCYIFAAIFFFLAARSLNEDWE